MPPVQPGQEPPKFNARKFGDYLKREIERRIRNVPFVVNENEDRLDIVKISFAFNNSDLINLLTKRGSLITSGKVDQLGDVNEKIQHIHDYGSDNLR